MATDLFGEEAPTPPPTTQTILADFLDYCTAKDIKIPKRLKGQYSAEIKSALDDKFTAKAIKNALASMIDDNVINRPSLLSNRLVAMQTGPEKPRHNDRQPRSSERRNQHQPYRDPEDLSAYTRTKI